MRTAARRALFVPRAVILWLRSLARLPGFSRLLGFFSRLLGFLSRLLGGFSRLLGGFSRLLGGFSRLVLGVERGVVRRAWMRRTVQAGSLAVAAAVLAMAGGDIWVRSTAQDHVYAVGDVPAAPVALVLGAKADDQVTPSAFLAARLEIARQLYADGKVRAILVSGDHREWGYNEPGAMHRWLVEHGVPTSQIVLDHAGFDTYDSCARARHVFGVTKLIIVTQSYHLDRAVALCRALGLDTDGVGDDTVRAYEDLWFNSAVRERGAIVKAVLDVASRRDPVFLGPRETSIETALS